MYCYWWQKWGWFKKFLFCCRNFPYCSDLNIFFLCHVISQVVENNLSLGSNTVLNKEHFHSRVFVGCVFAHGCSCLTVQRGLVTLLGYNWGLNVWEVGFTELPLWGWKFSNTPWGWGWKETHWETCWLPRLCVCEAAPNSCPAILKVLSRT